MATSPRAYWSDTYVPNWTFWNTFRAIACILSAGLVLLGVTLAL